MSNICVCCGAPTPEGHMVCWSCEKFPCRKANRCKEKNEHASEQPRSAYSVNKRFDWKDGHKDHPIDRDVDDLIFGEDFTLHSSR